MYACSCVHDCLPSCICVPFSRSFSLADSRLICIFLQHGDGCLFIYYKRDLHISWHRCFFFLFSLRESGSSRVHNDEIENTNAVCLKCVHWIFNVHKWCLTRFSQSNNTHVYVSVCNVQYKTILYSISNHLKIEKQCTW